MPENIQHEPDIASARPLWIIMLSTLGLVVVISFCVWAAVQYTKPAPGPARFQSVDTNPSGPRLQNNPTADLAVFNQKMSKRLSSVGWVNREEGRVHMPIKHAMRLLVDRGLPEELQ